MIACTAYKSSNSHNKNEYIFQPLAVQCLGTFSPSEFLREVGRRPSNASGDLRETSFLFQHISVILQRFNFALIHETFSARDDEPDL